MLQLTLGVRLALHIGQYFFVRPVLHFGTIHLCRNIKNVMNVSKNVMNVTKNVVNVTKNVMNVTKNVMNVTKNVMNVTKNVVKKWNEMIGVLGFDSAL